MDIKSLAVEFLRRKGVPAYLVGGSVRDQLMGRSEGADIDLAVQGDAGKLARAFADAAGGAFYWMHPEHNVARVIFDQHYVDFAALRGDVTSDLSTRDFTINAMARRVDSDEIVDPFHGKEDLRQGTVRAVSDAVFQNDPVRLLRAVRFASQFNFIVEPHTESLLRRDAARVTGAAMERARDELIKILSLPNVVAALHYMDDVGLLSHVLPELTALKGVTQSAPHVHDVFEHSLRALDQVVEFQTRGYTDLGAEFAGVLQEHFAQRVSSERSRGVLLRATTLLHDIGKARTRTVGEDGQVHFYEHEAEGAQMAEDIFRRLRFSGDELSIARTSTRHHLRPPQLARNAQMSNRSIYRYFRDTADVGVDVCLLALADFRGKAPEQINSSEHSRLLETIALLLDHYYHRPAEAVAPPPLLDGHTILREFKLQPGPDIGRLLESVREAQAEGEVSTREAALAHVAAILSRRESSPKSRRRR